MLKCSACPPEADHFLDLNDLEAHIAAEHYDCVPFECEKCRFSKFPTEFAIKRHFETDHRMKEYYIRYKISNALTEKLCSVRDCLQRSCEASGVEFPYKKFPALNNIEDAMVARNERHSYHRPRRMPGSNASSVDGGTDDHADVGVSIKSENGQYDTYSPCESADGDATPSVGGVAVANGDGPSAALTAFLQNASKAINEDILSADGDSNNNNDEKPTLRNDDLNALCSKLLCSSSSSETKAHRRMAGGNEETEDGTLASDVGESMDENQTQQLLRHLQSQLSNQPAPNTLLMRRKRQMDAKRLLMSHNAKRRFGQDAHNMLGQPFQPQQHPRMRPPGMNGYGQGYPNFFHPNAYNNGPHYGASTVVPPTAIMSRPTPARAPSKVNEVQCQKCKEMVTNRATSLNYHVNMKHLKFALFVCRGCARNFLWQRTTIVTHVQRYHNGDESLIEDNSSKFMSQINLQRKVYFPTKCPVSATATITSAIPITGPPSGANSSGGNGACQGDTGDCSGEFDQLSGVDADYSDPNGPDTSDDVPSTSVITSTAGVDTASAGGGDDDEDDDDDGDDQEDEDDEDASNGVGDMEDSGDMVQNMPHNTHHDGNGGTYGNQHYYGHGHHHGHHMTPQPASAPPTAGQNGHQFHHNGFNFNHMANNGYGGMFAANGMVMDVDEANLKKGRQLQCQVCNEMVVATKPWILLNHANSQHMNFPLFECGACHQVFTKYLRSYTVTHMKRYHDGREDLIIDNRPTYHAQLQAKCEELFGVSV